MIDTDGPAGRAAPTFVLVHGAFHGGWVWCDVARRLRDAGAVVHAPTFTGMGDRRHLLSDQVDVSLWVRDIVAVLEAEEVHDAVLVGHSFGGVVVGGVADRVPERLRHMVYLDAGVVESGESAAASIPADVWSSRVAATFEVDGVPCFPPPPASYFGVYEPDQVAWLERRLTPMPVRAYESSVSLSRPVGQNEVPKTFVSCTRPPLEAIQKSAQDARRNNWPFIELETGHNAMVTAAAEVSDILRAIATGDRHAGIGAGAGAGR